MDAVSIPTIVSPNIMNKYNDDESKPPCHTPDSVSKTPKAPSSSLKNFSKTDVMKLTDRLNISGTKPFNEINDFFGEMATKYGLEACNKTMDINQSKIGWSDKSRESIERAIHEVADPKAAEARKQAQKATQEAQAKETWNRSDWANVISDYQENRTDIFRPFGDCPKDMQKTVDKLKAKYNPPKQDTNHNQNNTDDGALAILAAYAPAAAKTAKIRNLSDYRS